MLNQKLISLLLLLTIATTATSCGKSVQNASVSSEQTSETDLSLPSTHAPTVAPTLMKDLRIPGVQFVTNLRAISSSGNIYAMTYDPTSSTATPYALLKWEKSGDSYKKPVTIALDPDYMYLSFDVSEDEKNCYFNSVAPKAHPTKSDKFSPFYIYQASLSDTKIANIKKLNVLPKNQTHLLADVDSQGNLLFATQNQNLGTIQAYYAKKDKNIFQPQEIKFTKDIDLSSLNKALFLENKAMLLFCSSDENGIITNLFSTGFTIDTKEISSLHTLSIPKELQEEQLLDVSASSDGTLLYFSTMNNSSEMHIYTLPTEDFFHQQLQNSTYSPCSYDDYDTSDYQMEYRDKGDMSQKQGVYYEIFVRSFADSNGDGIGDLNGVTEKLDYLKALGISGIWLMPINESPSYHGYDVTDYEAISLDYGTEEDFKKLLEEAHKRDISVIMDFVVNHTSWEHPWFQNAISGEDSEYRNYYRWVKPNDTTDFSPTAKSGWGSTLWHNMNGDYYYGIFNKDMPDLNYNNPKVRTEIKNAAKKWLDLGVDGFRLDAAIHIYGTREFAQQKDPEQANLQWWNEFARACEEENKNVYLVGEAWQEDDVLAAYAQPFDSKFNFTFADDMLNAIKEEKSISKSSGKDLAQSLADILDAYNTVSKGDYIDGIFASNHDQNRILSQVKSEEKAKLVANIYLTLPGNPFIYYGEELGMKGDGEDENKREPFKWSDDQSDLDTSWEPSNYNQDTASLEKQQTAKSESMYQHYKNILELRNTHTALQTGDYTPIKTKNKSIFAYQRSNEAETLILIHNLSKDTQTISLSACKNGTILYGDKQKFNKTITLKPYTSYCIKTEK